MGGSVETINIEVPVELADGVREYLKTIKRGRRILDRAFGILKADESAVGLKVEVYEELYG